VNEPNAHKALNQLADAAAELATVCDREVPDFAATWHTIASNAQVLGREQALLPVQADVAQLISAIVLLFGYHSGSFAEAYVVRANFDEQLAENVKFDALKQRVSAAAGALKQAFLQAG